MPDLMRLIGRSILRNAVAGTLAAADARLWHTGSLRPSLGAGLVLAF